LSYAGVTWLRLGLILFEEYSEARKALAYYERADADFVKHGRVYNLGVTMMNKGIVYIHL
jgi:hypothetical protein